MTDPVTHVSPPGISGCCCVCCRLSKRGLPVRSLPRFCSFGGQLHAAASKALTKQHAEEEEIQRNLDIESLAAAQKLMEIGSYERQLREKAEQGEFSAKLFENESACVCRHVAAMFPSSFVERRAWLNPWNRRRMETDNGLSLEYSENRQNASCSVFKRTGAWQSCSVVASWRK